MLGHLEGRITMYQNDRFISFSFLSLENRVNPGVQRKPQI